MVIDTYKDWTRSENKRNASIVLGELQYSRLPTDAAEPIETFITGPEYRSSNIEQVKREDPKTVTILWYDDAGAPKDRSEYASQSDYEYAAKPTKVPRSVFKRVESRIQELFGENWRVNRVSDERRDSGVNPQKVKIQRVDHQHFRYREETEESAQRKRIGLPDCVPEGTATWRELEPYSEMKLMPAHERKDASLFVYESSTGTQHLVDSDFVNQYPGLPVKTVCGHTVPPEAVRDGLEHYGEFVRRVGPSLDEDREYAPHNVLSDLCSTCHQSHYEDRHEYLNGILPPTEQYHNFMHEQYGCVVETDE